MVSSLLLISFTRSIMSCVIFSASFWSWVFSFCSFSAAYFQWSASSFMRVSIVSNLPRHRAYSLNISSVLASS